MNTLFYVGNRSDDEQYRQIRGKGSIGIVAGVSDRLEQQAESARRNGLKFYVSVPMSEDSTYEYIKMTDRGLEKGEDTIGFSGVKTIKSVEEMLGECASYCSGYFMGYPYFKQLYWHKEIAEKCRADYLAELEEKLVEAFDEAYEICDVRSWYYEQLSDYVFNKYIKPAADYIKDIGKAAIYNVGRIGMPYKLIRRVIKPVQLYKNGISIAAKYSDRDCAETEGVLSSLSEYGNYIVDATAIPTEIFGIDSVCMPHCEKATKGRRDAERRVLMIMPMRGTAERDSRRYVRDMVIENPALAASCESKFYCDMLRQKGFAYGAADEFALEEDGGYEGSRFRLFGKYYDDVLFCPSCIFSDKGIRMLEEASKSGVRVNDSSLIEELEREEPIL